MMENRRRILYHMLYDMQTQAHSCRVGYGRLMAAMHNRCKPIWMYIAVPVENEPGEAESRECFTAFPAAGRPVLKRDVYMKNNGDADGLRSFFIGFVQDIIEKERDAAGQLSLPRLIPGVVAERPAAEVCARAMAARYHLSYKMREIVAYFLPPAAQGADIFSAADSGPAAGLESAGFRPVPGFLRLARENDRSIILPWIAAFYREALQVPPPFEPAPVSPPPSPLSTETAITGVYIWDNGGPAAMGMISAGGPAPAQRLNLIYTPDNGRRQGYARQLVYALCQIIRREGCVPMLYTAAQNKAANELYRSLGFIEAGRLTEAVFV